VLAADAQRVQGRRPGMELDRDYAPTSFVCHVYTLPSWVCPFRPSHRHKSLQRKGFLRFQTVTPPRPL
jgi:hypothetical protein